MREMIRTVVAWLCIVAALCLTVLLIADFPIYIGWVVVDAIDADRKGMHGIEMPLYRIVLEVGLIFGCAWTAVVMFRRRISTQAMV